MNAVDDLACTQCPSLSLHAVADFTIPLLTSPNRYDANGRLVHHASQHCALALDALAESC